MTQSLKWSHKFQVWKLEKKEMTAAVKGASTAAAAVSNKLDALEKDNS